MKRKGIICYLVKNHEVLLLHVDYGEKGMIWSGVSGYVNENEAPKDATIREVKEELGVQIAQRDLEEVGSFDVDDISFMIFTTTQWKGEPTAQEDSIKVIKWFKAVDLPIGEMHPNMGEWMDKLLNKP